MRKILLSADTGHDWGDCEASLASLEEAIAQILGEEGVPWTKEEMHKELAGCHGFSVTFCSSECYGKSWAWGDKPSVDMQSANNGSDEWSMECIDPDPEDGKPGRREVAAPERPSVEFVTHRRYGRGQMVERKAREAVVLFSRFGAKRVKQEDLEAAD